MTNAAFVQRLADAEERFLYARMNEIDQFDALKTSARSKAHFQIMCLAFVPGNVYGQTRVGTGSVSERVCIRDEAGQMRHRQGIRRGSLKAMLNNWKQRGYIVEYGEAPDGDTTRQLFTKTNEYMAKHPSIKG